MPRRGEDARGRSAWSPAQMGMGLFLVSLGVLFAASLLACVLTRAHAPLWRTAGMPHLPWGLAVSTLLIAAVSASLELGLSALARNRRLAFERAIWASLVLAALFLLAQSFNWIEMARGYHAATLTLYPFTFHLLTGLHALHVLGGFAPLGFVLWRSGRDEYSSSRHEGVRLCAQYWHFLGVVWLVLVGALVLLAS